MQVALAHVDCSHSYLSCQCVFLWLLGRSDVAVGPQALSGFVEAETEPIEDKNARSPTMVPKNIFPINDQKPYLTFPSSEVCILVVS